MTEQQKFVATFLESLEIQISARFVDGGQSIELRAYLPPPLHIGSVEKVPAATSREWLNAAMARCVKRLVEGIAP